MAKVSDLAKRLRTVKALTLNLTLTLTLNLTLILTLTLALTLAWMGQVHACLVGTLAAKLPWAYGRFRPRFKP